MTGHRQGTATGPGAVPCLSGFLAEHPEDFRAIFLTQDKPDTATEDDFVKGSAALRGLDIFRRAIAEAQSRGEIIDGDPEELKNVLLCAFHGVALNLLTIPEYRWGSVERIRDTTVRLLIAGMTP